MKRILIISIIFAMIPIVSRAASLAPSVMELSGQRGEVLERTLTVINTKAMEQTYYLNKMKFVPGEEGGTPKFIQYQEDHSGLTEWISLPFSEFKLPANSKVDVPFSVAIPQSINSGGYYAALTVSNAPSDVVATNGATVEAKTAMLILLIVEGENIDQLAMLDFTAKNKGVLFDLGNNYQYRVQNQGNVHELPSGTLKLKDIFGRTIAETDANPSNGRVLPSSTRSFEVVFPKMAVFAIGPVTASLNLSYGSANQSLNTQLTLWYIPWQALVGLLILVVVMYFLKKQSKKQ